MESIRISQLAEVTSITDDDVLVVNDGDVNTRKITYANLSAGLVPKVGTTDIDGGLTLTGALTASDLLVDSGTLFVDSVNDRVGVGTQSPEHELDVNGIVQIRGGRPLRFNDPNNAFAVTFQSPVLQESQTYVFPTTFPEASGQLLSSTTAGVMSWATAFTDPMTSVGDMVFRDASNATTRLPIGGLGQVLTVQGDGTANWQNPVAAFVDPMTNAADIIVRDSANNTTRLGVGLAGQVLTVNVTADALEWQTPTPPATPTLSQVATSGSSTGVSISVGPLLTVQGNGSTQVGQLKLNCEQNDHGVIIQAPPHSAAASYTLTLPDDDGANGEVLSTDGSGNLSWVSAGGSSSASSFTWDASMIPDTNSTYDLGSAEYKVRHLFLSDNSIKFESGDLGVAGGALTFQGEPMQVASLNSVLTTLGVLPFPDNAGALGAGLVLGDVYYNTTTSKLTSVTP